MIKKSTYYHLLSCGPVPLNLSHLAKKTKKGNIFCFDSAAGILLFGKGKRSTRLYSRKQPF